MSWKTRRQYLEGYFYEDNDWSPIFAKRVVWSPIYAIFSSLFRALYFRSPPSRPFFFVNSLLLVHVHIFSFSFSRETSMCTRTYRRRLRGIVTSGPMGHTTLSGADVGQDPRRGPTIFYTPSVLSIRSKWKEKYKSKDSHPTPWALKMAFGCTLVREIRKWAVLGLRSPLVKIFSFRYCNTFVCIW